MFTDADAIAKVEQAMQKKDFLSDLDHGPEYIISQLMEKSMQINTRGGSAVVDHIK